MGFSENMVDILLATYNGEKYVKTQILSLISQSYLNWNLIIHDDGSTDDTVKIIKELAAQDSRIKLIEDGVSCKSAALNFMHLLRYSTSAYVMFCDQDDIWFDNKVEYMYCGIRCTDDNTPNVLYTNAYVWSSLIGILGNATSTFPPNINSLLFLKSGIQGCASIFNAKMRDLLLKWNGPLAMHDHLLHLLGCSVGNVYYKDIPLMLYRNHDKNVTGGTRINKNDIRSIYSAIDHPVVCKKHYDAVVMFREQYADVLGDDKKRIIDAYINLPNKGLLYRSFSILKNQFKCYDSTFRILIKMILKPYIK